MTEFESKKSLQDDFLSKLIHKKISGYDEYYAMAEDKSVPMARQVSNCKAELKQIEQNHFNRREKELPTLEPMLNTLKNYLEENEKEDQEAMTLAKLYELLGAQNSIYYGIMRACVQKFLKGSGKSTSRCIILYGASSSGKSTIAKYLSNIFISFDFRQHKGLFDENMTQSDTNVQLIVLDEANVYSLFDRRNIADTKQLLEGQGRSIAIKHAHSFTGFKGAYTVLTANHLPYPFIPPANSTAGFNFEEYLEDQKAMKARCKIFKMFQTFNRELTFPFTEYEFAQMMLLTYDSWDEMPEYEFDQPQNAIEIIMQPKTLEEALGVIQKQNAEIEKQALEIKELKNELEE